MQSCHSMLSPWFLLFLSWSWQFEEVLWVFLMTTWLTALSTSVDRSTLETVSQPADEFVESFCSRLEALLTHSFIAKQQSQFYSEMKTSPSPGVFVVSADISENYAFVLQDAAQGYHWNNAQATVHPFVIYYTDSNSTNHLNFVVISDCLHHDTIAVYLFQQKLIAFLKKQCSTLKKIIHLNSISGPSTMFQEFISVIVALKSTRNKRFSYKLGLNRQQQFLVRANYILSFRFPRPH